MKRLDLFIIAVLLTAFSLSAATFTVIPPRRVGVGDKFAVTFRLDNGDGSDIRVSQINGCTLIFGPATSQSRSYQVINGHSQSSSRTEYTYTYRADKAGTFTIPEASIMVGGKRMKTPPTKFTVESRAQASAPTSSRPVELDDIDTQSSDRAVGANDVFVRIILSRPSVYEQEAVECTIKLYTKYSISEFIPTKQPSFDGFLIQELDIRPELNAKETYNGQPYLTAILKKCIIFPQKAGKLTINSGNYDLAVVQYDNVNMGGFLTVRQPRERRIKVSSNSATLDVKPLPTPKPEGFTGAVGTFTVDTRLIGNTFRTNDPATLVYTITGTGNIKYVKEPVIDFPSEFEQYTPKSDIQAQPSGTTVTGTMTIEYTFVPQSVGDFKIGSDKFVYFNPSTAQYVTLTTPSYDIKVAKGTAAASSRDQEDIAAKNNDILHIHLGDKHLSKSHEPVVDKIWFWLLWVVLGLALGVAIGYNRERLRLAADVKGQRLARAGKVAKRRLAKAAQFMKEKKADAFYEENLKALMGYLSDKLSIPASQLSRDNITSALAEIGADDQLREHVISLIDRCEMARYTPDSPTMVDSVYYETSDLINKLETFKKRPQSK